MIDVSISDSTSRFPITKYAAFLRTTEKLPIDSVLKSRSFEAPQNKPVLVVEYDPYYYWFRIVVQNPDNRSRQFMLLMAPVGLYEGGLFQKNNGQWQEVAHAGLKYKFEDRSYQFAHHVFPFILAPQRTDTLYISIDASNVYKSFGFALIQPKELKIFENRIYFVFGIIVGLLLLFFILNIALFIALGEKLHLWYALYIALLFLIVMKNDHLDQQFLGLDSEMAFRMTPYMAIGAFAIAVLMHVVQKFFKVVLKNNRILYRLSTVLKLNVLLSAISHAVVFQTTDTYQVQAFVFSWAKISVLLGICMIIANCIYAMRKGFKSAWFIFSGSLVFMLGSLQRLFFPSTLSFLFPPTTFHIGIILETFVISMGLIYRYWSEKELQRQIEEQVKSQTLKEVSEEIHDNIGQILSLARITIFKMNIKDTQSLQQKIDGAQQLVGRAIKDLRNLSRILNSENVIENGLLKSMEKEINYISKTAEVNISLIKEGEGNKLSHRQEMVIFRIFQEILNNSLKHSKAHQITVRAGYLNNHFELQVTDDGQGFDTSILSHEDHIGLGLRNLKHRSSLIGADFHIESKIGEGTDVKVVLPIN